MNAGVCRAIELTLGQRLLESKPCAGGDINQSCLARLADGQRVFVKTNPQATRLPGLFAAEADGLKSLRAAAAGTGLRIPEVLAFGDEFLVLEAIDEASPPSDFEERLGRGLAQLHQATRDDTFGWPTPNYLGRWRQPPGETHDPITFWRQHRLLPMLLDLSAYPDVVALGQRLADRLDDVLAGREAESVLIHGDLWSGNACADRDGQVWVYDPACCRADREVEFGMTRLFGFGARFEAAYQEVWPLAEGWERRVEVYRLHHLLSHLWHFGGGYHGPCISLLQTLV